MRWRDSGEVDAAEASREEGRHRHADHAQGEHAGLAHRTRMRPTRASSEHDDEHRPAPAAEVTGRPPQVRDDRPRPSELRAPASDADVEAPREDEVGEPERDARDDHGRKGGDGLAHAVTAGRDDEHGLRGQYERSVRMRGDRRARSQRPRAPRAASRRGRGRAGAARTRAGRGRGRGCTSARRPRGRGRPSCRRRVRSRSAPSPGRRAAGRAAPRAGGSPTANAADARRRLPRPSPRWATA